MHSDNSCAYLESTFYSQRIRRLSEGSTRCHVVSCEVWVWALEWPIRDNSRSRGWNAEAAKTFHLVDVEWKFVMRDAVGQQIQEQKAIVEKVRRLATTSLRPQCHANNLFISQRLQLR
jgi:hypothetical protein